MEKQVSIIEQLPLVSRSYTAQDGTQKVYHSRGFVLSDGIDEFFAEMTGDTALACPDYDRSTWHNMQGYMRQRSYTDKAGNTRYENQIYINRLV